MLSRLAKASSIAQRSSSLIFRAASSNVASSEPRRYPHDAPERDFVNFPPPSIAEEAGKLRIGLVPDEWFKAMYPKTGVTGPYLLFWGGLTYIFSKEIFVCWVDTPEQIVFLALLVFVSKKFGKQLGEMTQKFADDANQEKIDALAARTTDVENKITKFESQATLPEANKLIYAAKKENVQLQLEASYRQRLAQVYQEVKKRLDYQVSVQSVHRRLEKDQAINYIINEVNKSIGPNQEKEAFDSGLGQLRALSQKYAGTI